MKTSLILVVRLGRGVGGLDGLLLDPEGVHLGLQPLTGRGQLLFLALQRLVLSAQVVELALHAALAGERLPGQVLPAGRERITSLAIQLVSLLLH